MTPTVHLISSPRSFLSMRCCTVIGNPRLAFTDKQYDTVKARLADRECLPQSGKGRILIERNEPSQPITVATVLSEMEGQSMSLSEYTRRTVQSDNLLLVIGLFIAGVLYGVGLQIWMPDLGLSWYTPLAYGTLTVTLTYFMVILDYLFGSPTRQNRSQR